MSIFNNIPKEGTWGQAADLLNANFAQADVTLESLKNATTRNKGYYSTSSVLRNTHPSGPDGSIAYVGTESPFAVWRYEAGWYDTGIKSVLEGADLTEYYTKAEINAKLDTLSLVVENDLAYVSIGGEKKGQGIEITGGGSGGDEGDDDNGGDTTESVSISGNSSLVEGDSTTFTATVSPTQSSVIWSITGGASGDSISSSGKLTTTEYGSARTIVVKATTANGAYSTKSVSVQKAVRPSTVTISGKTSIAENTNYILTLAPSGINKSYSTTWSLSGVAYSNGYVSLSNKGATSCTVIVNNRGTNDTTFILSVAVVSDSVNIKDTLEITLQKASSQPSTSGVSTIRIDQNISDPNGMIALTSDDNGEQIELIRQNSHRYLGKYTSAGTMTICQLKDDDSNYYNDGAAAVLTGGQGDVFMKLPHFWYRAEHIGDNVFDISFAYGDAPSDVSSWEEWNGNELIGTYMAYIDGDNSLRSVSGVNPSPSLSHTNFRKYARSRGNGYYDIVGWRHHNIMALLFYAYYRHTDAQSQCGNGASYLLPDGGQTGDTNSLGMEDTTPNASGTYATINFWGLEDWWGRFSELMSDTFLTLSGATPKWAGSGPSGLFPIADGLEKYFYSLAIVDTSGEFSVVPTSGGATSSTNYCDGGQFLIPETEDFAEMLCADRGGVGGADAKVGIVALNTKLKSDETNQYIGSRLIFSGTITEVQSSSTFKNLSAIN